MAGEEHAMEIGGHTGLRRWHALATGSLLLAGVLSLMLVIGRVPPFSQLPVDPLFFRRCLVVHVNLALVVWFHAFLAGLVQLLAPSRRLGALAATGGAAGVALLLLAALVRGAEPVLSNYVPMIDHPLFAAGLVVFGLSVALSFPLSGLVGRTEASSLPPAAQSALRGAAVAFLLALLTFHGAWLSTPGDLPTEAYWESVMWGGGHVLQVVSVAAMLACWSILLSGVLGRAPVGPRAGAILTALLVLPMVAAPLLAVRGTVRAGYRDGFTWLMEFGIFPVVLAFLGLVARAVSRARREGTLEPSLWRDVRWTGFLASAALSLTGFLLGATIHGSNTLVPAHYHAAIGAVTASFMTVTYVLLPRLGLALPGGRLASLARWQPVLFGAGQVVFALGFGLAGVHGMARKTYGAEQHVRGFADWLGLVLMGVGGLVAVAGGLFFLGLLVAAWRARLAGRIPPETRSVSWEVPTEGTPSRS